MSCVQIENLPAALRETGLFCCWRYETRPGADKPTKCPYNPRTGGGAMSNNPATFAPLSVALEAAGRYDGLGVGLFGDLGAIDIDHCVDDTGVISEMALDIMTTMQGYTEYSPSGKGMRILFRASGFQYDKARFYTMNAGRGLEVYIAGCTSKFVTVTGNALTPGLDLEERGEQLQAVLEKYMVRPAREKRPTGGPAELDDLGLIERAKRGKNGDQFAALWAGGTSGYPSRSEADIALCNALAWWTNGDAARVDRLFRASGLMRDKWDRAQSGSTYGAITIQNAVSTARTGYEPGYRPVSSYEREAPPEWELPVPFDEVETPAFPLDALPGPLFSFAECLAESTQTPEEMVGVLSLGVLAAAFQSRYEVEITPDWREPLCLYTVAVAPPGERKSAVISALTRPVHEYERMRRELEAEEIARNQTERAMLEVALRAAQTKASKGKADAAREEALDLSAQLAGFKDKHPFRLLVDDATPEKLVDLMDMQNGCITLASAEGGVFDSMSGRYDKAANFDVYLKGHAGDPITVDRIGRKPNHIAAPRLTMLLTIQPEVLQGLMSNATMRGRGLCGRFLYVMCRSKVGRRNLSPAPVPEEVKAAYRQFVRRILDGQGSGIIRLGPEADRIRLEYMRSVEKRLGDEWEHMRDWGGKAAGAMVRIAALIHASEVQGDPAGVPIGPEVMTAAVRIMECLGKHAEAAYQAMGSDESYEDAKYLWRRMESAGQDELTKNELIQLTRGKFKKAESMEPPLRTLMEMGYIRRESRKTGGRPSEIILINPFSKASKDRKAPA